MKYSILSFILFISLGSFAQELRNKKDGGYKFTVVKDLEATAVDNQYRSSTCWSFSSLSFFESEMIRQGKDSVGLSEMFVVWHTYNDKANRYVRMHGALNFGPGGAFHDALHVIEKYGIVPESVYSGKNYGEKKHIHGEMDELLLSMVKSVSAQNGKITPQWNEAVKGTLNAYLGPLPATFQYQGKSYTPRSFADQIGIKASDYIEIGSYTHHPFYSQFILEVPDNWAGDKIYNVPLDKMAEIIDNALMNGYTIAWATDVSEKGFSFKNGVAIVPEKDWVDMKKEETDTIFNTPIPQKRITQEIRQKAFDNYETQDDHGMHITGIVKDQNGQKYYIVKNSWGVDNNDCDGYFYASEAYVLYKTTAIMINKKALNKEMTKQLHIE